MIIRNATNSDIERWSGMRDSLWPESSTTSKSEIKQFFANESSDIQECFLVEENEGPVGFIELSIRIYAEGSSQTNVPYVEGWYVEKSHRGKGLGKLLMTKAETWAKGKGFSELASDAEIEKRQSISAHIKLGFTETDRIVCFLKQLN